MAFDTHPSILARRSLPRQDTCCDIDSPYGWSLVPYPVHFLSSSDEQEDHKQEAVAYQLLLGRLDSFATFGLTEGAYVRVVKTDWIGEQQYSYCVLKISRKHALVATWVGFLDIGEKDRRMLLKELKDTVLCGLLDPHDLSEEDGGTPDLISTAANSDPSSAQLQRSSASRNSDRNGSEGDISDSETEDAENSMPHTWHGMHQDDQQRWLRMCDTSLETQKSQGDSIASNASNMSNGGGSGSSDEDDTAQGNDAFADDDSTSILSDLFIEPRQCDSTAKPFCDSLRAHSESPSNTRRSSCSPKDSFINASELHGRTSTPTRPRPVRVFEGDDGDLQDIILTLEPDGKLPCVSALETPDRQTPLSELHEPTSVVLQNNLVALLPGAPFSDQVEPHVNSYGSLARHLWQLQTQYDYDDEKIAIEVDSAVIARGLAHQRLNDGFVQVLSSDGGTTFAKEFQLNILPTPDAEASEQSELNNVKPLGCAISEPGITGTCLIHYTVSAADTTGNVLSQVWVEPQSGQVVDDLAHFNGLTFEELSRYIFHKDKQFVSAVSTFQYLETLAIQQLDSEFDLHGLPKLSPVLDMRAAMMPNAPPLRFEKGTSITDMEFQLDLTSITEFAHSVELRFPGFSDELAGHVVSIRTQGLPVTQQPQTSDKQAMTEEDLLQGVITYQSSSDFRQDLLVNMLRTGCGIEVTLDAKNSSFASKILGSEQTEGHSGYHCFVTTFEDHLMLTLVASPRIVLESARTSTSEDTDQTLKDYHGVVRVFECKKEDILRSTFNPNQQFQHDVVDFSNERLCGIVDNIPDFGTSKSLPRYVTILCSLYIKSFVASIYWCLQLGLAVTPEDMHNARDVCASSDEEVNLTELLKRLAVKTDQPVAPGIRVFFWNTVLLHVCIPAWRTCTALELSLGMHVLHVDMVGR